MSDRVMWDATKDHVQSMKALDNLFTKGAENGDYWTVIMRGRSGVGKSTWVDRFMSEYSPRRTQIIGIDRTLADVTNDKDRYFTYMEEMVTDYAWNAYDKSEELAHVIVDNMHLHSRSMSSSAMMYDQAWREQILLVDFQGPGDNKKIDPKVYAELTANIPDNEKIWGWDLWTKVFVLEDNR